MTLLTITLVNIFEFPSWSSVYMARSLLTARRYLKKPSNSTLNWAKALPAGSTVIPVSLARGACKTSHLSDAWDTFLTLPPRGFKWMILGYAPFPSYWPIWWFLPPSGTFLTCHPRAVEYVWKCRPVNTTHRLKFCEVVYWNLRICALLYRVAELLFMSNEVKYFHLNARLRPLMAHYRSQHENLCDCACGK